MLMMAIVIRPVRRPMKRIQRTDFRIQLSSTSRTARVFLRFLKRLKVVMV